MRKKIICFSERGRCIAEKLNREYEAHGMEPAECAPEGYSADDFVREGFKARSALIFVGAVGIAVRLISPYIKDKLSDSPVIVIDDAGTFVIPVLSGHAGGANKIAATVAGLIGAVPVITTSTDVNTAFSADVFAKENALGIADRAGIKKVSAKAIEGKRITLSIKDYPPDEPVDIIIADETDREYDLLLKPKMYTLGVGLRKGKDEGELSAFLLDVLGRAEITIDDIYAVSTIDIKEDEPAVKAFCDKYAIPLITFEASVLKRAKGDFTASSFVEDTVGVDNVCERSAVLAAGARGHLVLRKTSRDGMTAAIASRQA
ncbi:MAG: cobalamin biosynthesis protein [Lachnospiraceae bacterium]|nr:cobalamin biosynthesis protein [Lachnospiraceae bacterium]